MNDKDERLESEIDKGDTPGTINRPPGVQLVASVHPVINVALWANHVPILTELTLINDSEEMFGDVVVNVTSSPNGILPRSWRLAEVGPGQMRAFDSLDLQLDGAWLGSLTESIRGSVTFTARSAERVIAEVQRDVRFLAHNEWGGNRSIPDILAAFVEPNDTAVASVIHKASDLLRAQGKPDCLEGHQATSKQRLWEQAAAVWSAVCSLDIRYVNPPPSFEQFGQRIRPPRQILNERLGTCLDLTVFFAACLEHIGLRPLVVLTKGHAFAGMWLSKHDFGASVVDDAPSLRTRLALSDLVLFETTLCTHVPAPGFRQACAAGAEQVAVGRDDKFENVIDIHRARERRIRPLSAPLPSYARSAIDGNSEGIAPVVDPPSIEDAPVLHEDDQPESEPPPASPSDRLARWRKQLLDLSGRNRLLNLRLGGRQTLAIDCYDPAKLEDMLAEMRGATKQSPLRFRSWPDLMAGNDPRSAKLHRDRLDEEANRAFARDALAKRELLISLDEQKLQLVLTELFRIARSSQQEGGCNTLYLTIGSLLWKPKNKDKTYRAPLILIPVVLERPNVRSGFHLRAHDDETRVNATLLELLKQEFGIRLPELETAAPEDSSGLNVHAILDAFRRKLREMRGWEVTEEVALTNLSFTKYLMWKDLVDRAVALRESEIARRLMDGPTHEPDTPKLPDSFRPAREAEFGATLDDDLEFQGLVCPMEADSSQIRAIALAARGESYVLIGPPGTGKSQTITNIISNSLAQGKSVLFVAEKRAALEVVQRRLRQVGLGDFCLDLFSTKTSKIAVLEQLNKAQKAREKVDQNEWLSTIQELAAIRAELNGYVRELHRRGRNGWTPYRAIGLLLRAETGGLPEIALSWPSPDSHDASDYQRLLQATEDATATLARLGDFSARSQLTGIERTDWSPSWQVSLINGTQRAVHALNDLKAVIPSVLRAMGLPSDLPLTRQTIDALGELARLLIESTAPAAVSTLIDGTQGVREALREAASIAREHAALARSLRTEWLPAVQDLPLPSLLAQWREASGRWWLKRRAGQKAVRAHLATATARVPDDPSEDLETLIAMRAKADAFASFAARLAPLFGPHWRGLQTDFGAFEAAIASAIGLRSAMARCAQDPVALLALRSHVSKLLTDGADLLSEGGSVGAPLRVLISRLASVKDALTALTPLCGRDPSSLVADSDEDWAGHLAERISGWTASASNLRDWCAWRKIVQTAENQGLGPLLNAMEAGLVAPGDAVRTLEANYARWWIAGEVEDLPRLRAFVAATHEKGIERFRELDRRMLVLAARVARARIVGAIPNVHQRQASPEFSTLSRELVKRQRHLPVRQLIGRMPHAIRRLTPCLMMSPLSVAQYIPAEADSFDLVIFDEASQIPTWDAIGVVSRGRQVIVVGDPKQLPPTRFFERAVPNGGETSSNETRVELEIEDLESILDECLGAGIPSVELNWHYRSRHESLIAFSNHRYYGGRLVTFPSPVVRDTAVSFHHVVDGVYARAGARTNQAEARAVVADVIARLCRMTYDGRTQSIGIVTFNAEQQALIENLLDEERRKNPSLERFFSDDLDEPVFVKNLESVQGEERDIIIFSLTYGPDITGRVGMNFGPLNQAGGERRLNVAITRAREALIVFGSLRSEHIDLSRTSAIGVAHLKEFLTFAEHGARAFTTSSTGPLGDFESPFEVAVAERLRNLGWVVHPQIGVSGFRVDLGIVDPDSPGAFLAGIECDGATYHRSASARDRDRLRQTVLENLGWRILRIWSTDWWTNAGREVKRLHAELSGLLEDRRLTAAKQTVVAPTEPESEAATPVSEPATKP